MRPQAGFLGNLRSLFWLHNETGNIWTHLIGAWAGAAASAGQPCRRAGRVHAPRPALPLSPGFLIFACLTVATVRWQPAPLDLGPRALAALEARLFEQGKASLRELLEVGWGVGGGSSGQWLLVGTCRAHLVPTLCTA